MSSQKKAASDLVSGLMHASGDNSEPQESPGEGAASVRAQILANFRETPDDRWADLFVVLVVQGELFVRSTQIVLEDTCSQFSIFVREWAFVDVMWRCQDRNIDSRGLAQILKSNAPDLYHIDAQTESLTPLDESLYERILASRNREFRQFAFLTDGPEPLRIEAALREKIRRVHGWPLENPLTWRKRVDNALSPGLWFAGLTLREAQRLEAEIAAADPKL
jgi:hypothetical protein